MGVHSLNEDGTSNDFNALSKALCAGFLPPSATVRAHMQLNCCVQGDKSVTAYGEHLRRLAMLAYPPGSPEGHAVVRDRRALDRFVVPLKDGELRVKVLEGKPKSLRQAVNIAEEYAAIVDLNGDSASRSVALPAYQVLEAPLKGRRRLPLSTIVRPHASSTRHSIAPRLCPSTTKGGRSIPGTTSGEGENLPEWILLARNANAMQSAFGAIVFSRCFTVTFPL
jgi:hypothetical protein